MPWKKTTVRKPHVNPAATVAPTQNWECASDLFGDEITLEPCDSGVASHVFNPDATGIDRYLR